jgi:hypothetical protein
MKAAERQDAAQRQAKELASRNIKALSEQIETVATRLRLARVQLDRITGLIAKGAAGGAMQTVQEGVIAELEGQNSEMKSEMVDAERLRIAEDAAFESSRHERRTRLLLEIQTAQRELQERQASLADSKRILRIYQEAIVENKETTGQTITYRIVRIVEGQAREFDVSEVSTLTPGDLVRVIFSDSSRRRSTPIVEVRPENLNSSRTRSATSQLNRISGVSQ